MSVTAKAGFDYAGIESSDSRSALGTVTLRRGDAQAGFNIDVPLTSRKEAFGAGIGNVSVNANAEVHRLSDFGTLYNWGGGLTWSPVERLSFSANYSDEGKAPTVQQLNDPTVGTPNTPVFDFRTGQTVEINRITGGDPMKRANLENLVRHGADLGLTRRHMLKQLAAGSVALGVAGPSLLLTGCAATASQATANSAASHNTMIYKSIDLIPTPQRHHDSVAP
mgnify:CR=1 FL=1